VNQEKKDKKEEIMEKTLAVIEEELTKKTNPVVSTANALTVSTVEEKRIAVSEMGIVKGLIKKVEETFKPIKQKARAVHQEIRAQEKKYLLPLETALATIKDKIGAFDLEMKHRKEEEQQRIINEQKAKALEKIDNILASTADVEEIIEIIGKELERTDLNSIERQELEIYHMMATCAAKESSEEEIKEAQTSEPVFAPPVLSVPETKVKGSSTHFTLIPQVVDKLALVRAVADGIVPDNILDINQGRLKRHVNAIRKTVPGVTCTEEAIISSR
jgi:hypothetical protein